VAAEADYGWVENSQQNLTAAGPLNIRTNVHEATGALVVTLPHTNRIYQYLLAGGGALVFDPTSNAAGALWQAKGAFLYGGGLDFAVARHVALRAEYRGFVYDRPDFGSPLLASNVIANTARFRPALCSDSNNGVVQGQRHSAGLAYAATAHKEKTQESNHEERDD
jgi:opacity protein-like surface antigen